MTPSPWVAHKPEVGGATPVSSATPEAACSDSQHSTAFPRPSSTWTPSGSAGRTRKLRPQQRAWVRVGGLCLRLVALAVCFSSSSMGPLLCSRARASVGNKIKRSLLACVPRATQRLYVCLTVHVWYFFGGCYELSCVPSKDIGVLFTRTCEWNLIWRRYLCR